MNTPTAKAGAGRPKLGYHLKDGSRVPSVTTIISRFKDSGGLIHWAWDLGTQGKDYREERDRAADAGSAAHAAVEASIHGKEWDWDTVADPETRTKAKSSFGAFQEWRQQTNLQITQTEMPLTSETYRFGGTFDAILVQQQRSIGDWKTSNAIYGDYLIQIAAYGKLWQENFPDDPIKGGFHLLRFDKTYGDFSHRWWAELDKAWEAFLHLRALYEIEKELKARAK